MFDLGAQSNSSPDPGQLLRTSHRRNKSRNCVQDPNGYKSPNRDIKLVNGYGPGPGRPPTDWKPQRSRQLVRLVLDSDIPLVDIPAALKDGDFHPCKTSCRTQFIKLTGVPPDKWRLHDPKKKEVRKAQMIAAMNVALSEEAQAEASLPSGPFPVALVPQQETHSQYPVDSSNLTLPSSDLSSTTLTPSVSSFHQLETASTDSAICFNSPGDWTNDFSQNILTMPNSSGIISNVKSDGPAAFRKQHVRKVSAPGDLEGAMSKHTRWPSKMVQDRLYEFIKKRLSISRSSIASAVSLSGSIRSRWSNHRTSSQRLADRQSTGTSTVMHEINATPMNTSLGSNITDVFEHFSGSNYDYVTALLKRFHQRGASVDDRNSKGETALHIAAGHGNISACEFLLREGANVYATTSTGESISAYTKSKSRRVKDPGRYAKIKVCRNMIKEHEMGKPLKIRSPPERKRNAVAVTPTAQETCPESSTTWIDGQLTSSPVSSISVMSMDSLLSGEMDASQAPWNAVSRGIVPLGIASLDIAPPVNMGNRISPNFDDSIFVRGAPTSNSFSYPPGFRSLSQQSTMTVNPPAINTSFGQVQWEYGGSGANFIPDGSERIYSLETIEAGITDADMDNALAVTSQYALDPGYQAGFELAGQHTASRPFGNILQGTTGQYGTALAHTSSHSRFSDLPALATDTQGDQYSMELSPHQLLPDSNVNYPPTSAHGKPVSPLYEEVPSTFEDSNISSGNGVTFGGLNMNACSWEEFGGQGWS